VVAAEEQQARARGDGDAYGVGELKTAAALPVLLVDKHLHEVAQARALVVVEVAPVREIALQHGLPRGGEGVGQDLVAATARKPREGHMREGRPLCPRRATPPSARRAGR
jgi:hypothetical protein